MRKFDHFLLQIIVTMLLSLALLSCSNSAQSDEETGQVSIPETIENTILRPQGSAIFARPLLYKNESTISYCESTKGTLSSYSGYRDLKPYPLASVSKVFLTAWALQKLGADYRFQMVWKLKRISNQGDYDAYLQTNYDPIVNIEKIIFALAELNKKGVLRIRNLVIDQTTRVYLSVLTNPHLELQDVPVSTGQSLENLETILNSKNWSSQTEIAKKNIQNTLLSNSKNILFPNEFAVQNVSYRPRNQIDLNYYNDEVRIQSSILVKYLKEVNVFSNNYVTDSLFSLLGGAQAFDQFQSKELKISKQELKIYTGSGLSLQINGDRVDNSGSCLSVLKTLKYLDLISARSNLNLGHVLLTAGMDQGTYESNLTFNKNVVLKTGRLYDVPTLNVAGISASQNGHTYFAVMAHDFDNADESAVKIKRDELIADLMGTKQIQSSFLTLALNTLFFKF